jgi:AraC family transcriptional regulator, transcriptional activator FtrA
MPAHAAGRDHRVVCLAFDGLAPFELGVAAEVFALARPELDMERWYEFALCAPEPGPLRVVGGFTVVAPHGLEALADADTVIVPGVPDPHADPPPPVLAALRAAHARGARVVSICSGAFALAAAGLLDGREAATHWRYAELLAERFPAVRVNADVLYLDGGAVLTSAGTAAGIDLCLHLIRRDHGAEIANRVARRMVVAAHRDGGQAQFIEAPVAGSEGDDPVGRAMEHALARLGEPLSVADLARSAHLSPRQLERRFRAATGTSPGRWLIGQRVQASLPMLELGAESVETVAGAVGFTPAGYRRHFRARLGISPAAYRQRFRAARPAPG